MAIDLRDVPEEKQTYEMCLASVMADGQQLQYVNAKFQTDIVVTRSTPIKMIRNLPVNFLNPFVTLDFVFIFITLRIVEAELLQLSLYCISVDISTCQYSSRSLDQCVEYREQSEQQVKCEYYCKRAKDSHRRTGKHACNITDSLQFIDNIIQFISVIREMCNMGTEIVNNEVEDILYNRENFKSYIAMKNSEKNITSKVLKQIIKRLNEWALPKGFSIDDIYNNYDKEIDELCEGKKIGDKFPGFGIICQNTRFNCTLRICFEANARGSLYYGIYIVNDEDRTAEIFNRIRISISDLGGKSQSNYWPYFKYLTVQDQEIDFVKPNDAFAELLNEETLNRCIEFIEEQLLNLVKIVEME